MGEGRAYSEMLKPDYLLLAAQCNEDRVVIDEINVGRKYLIDTPHLYRLRMAHGIIRDLYAIYKTSTV
ncbi:MAG: hypothetical protein DRO13_02840 [Thermoprotei archaeon]|nr:MAG: hypothetical protein DRO13_02840 [Thermoprotei archaeon]